MANAVKSAGQHMQQEAAHELLGTEGHGFVVRFALGPIVLPAKGHTASVKGHEPTVGDGDPVGSGAR